ncbi:hypothetical protein [Novosphingobium sp. PhB165]|uniref:hypothetical protein n=1 Tax=Novosphingobium sp. PhB165 TaxID=2485105 RepID=UPI001404D11F|nr:hypothetical protein [Novosphingobium sp. PhB165]
MIERAARALAESESGHDDWDGLDKDLQEELKENARAVIQAIRLPSRAVSGEGEKCLGHEARHGIDWHDMEWAWTRMVDALLAEARAGGEEETES